MMHDAVLRTVKNALAIETDGNAAHDGQTVKTIFLIAGSEQTHCGVYDYTARLTQAIEAHGYQAELYAFEEWSLPALNHLVTKFRGRRDSIIHMQYPSVAMKRSMLPALLPLLLYPTPVYLTLHEFSIFSLPRKLIFWTYARFAKLILFSNDFERKAFSTFFKGAKAQLHIVPIGSNIEASVQALPPLNRRPPKLVYFGQISESKGIEIFLEAVATLRARKIAFQAAIIGAVMDEHSSLMAAIREAAAQHDIDLRFDLPSSEVAEELASARLAILPFPDGISDKRGSALACLNHGVVVITKQSEKTPEWLKRTTLAIRDSETCANLAAVVLNNPLEARIDWTLAAKELQRRQWSNIALEHISLYQQANAS